MIVSCICSGWLLLVLKLCLVLRFICRYVGSLLLLGMFLMFECRLLLNM